MSLLRSAMGRGSKPFIFEAKTMPLIHNDKGCKKYEKTGRCPVGIGRPLLQLPISEILPKGLISCLFAT
jgi:hypothetical protein